MSRRFVIVGTDTNVGKTIVAAALVGALDAAYWKPVQAGLEGETDSQTVARLSGVAPSHILPEAYRLRRPASPHIAARAEGLTIDAARLAPPNCAGDIIIETAGGVMVPLNDDLLTIDLLAQWALPVILVARTGLGTINHSLLTLEALRRRNVSVHGVVFVGDEEPEAQRSIAVMGDARILGRLQLLAPLTRETLRHAFDAAFLREDFIP